MTSSWVGADDAFLQLDFFHHRMSANRLPSLEVVHLENVSEIMLGVPLQLLIQRIRIMFFFSEMSRKLSNCPHLFSETENDNPIICDEAPLPLIYMAIPVTKAYVGREPQRNSVLWTPLDVDISVWSFYFEEFFVEFVCLLSGKFLMLFKSTL